jgi:hypothetical protein
MVLRNLMKAVAVSCLQPKLLHFFAVEGVFKGLEKINEYVSLKRNTADSNIKSESAYW